MFKWLPGLRQKTKPFAADANRKAAKSSERSEPPGDVDPIEELVRIVARLMTIDALATLLALLEQARAAPARVADEGNESIFGAQCGTKCGTTKGALC